MGLGLGKNGPLHVADAGNLGGGIWSCFGGFGGSSASLSAGVLDELRLRVRLNLRRKLFPNDGVVAPVGLGSSMLEAWS